MALTFKSLNVVTAITLLWVAVGWAKPTRYALDVDQNRQLVKLQDNVTKTDVWSHPADVKNFVTVTWSADHKSVAIDTTTLKSGLWQIWAWREGQPLKVLRLPQFPHDYNMGTIWAPDGKSLLVRPGGSADADMGPTGIGSVFALRLKAGSKPHFKLVGDMIWKVSWRDKRTVAYWVLDEKAKKLSDTPHYWHIR